MIDNARKNFWQFIFIVFATTFASYSQAQEKQPEKDLIDLPLEELMNIPISVSSKTEQSLDQTPGTVRVITRKQIDDMNARTLKDVLNIYVPGIDATPNTFKYDDRGEFFYSRGINTDFCQQVLILYNGKNKFIESTFGGPYIAMDFTLEMIDRIEISTTPTPVQGGSAITTFNLITRDRTMEGAEVQVNTGFNAKDIYQSQKVSGMFGGTSKSGWHVASSLQVYTDKGQVHRLPAGNGGYTGDPSDLRDGIKNASNFSINIKSPDQKLEIGSWYKVVNKDALLSGLTPSPSSNTYNYEGKVLNNYISYTPTKNWTLTGGATNYYFENYYLYGTPNGYTIVDFDYYLESLHKAKVGKHSFVFGAKAQAEGQSKSNTYVWNASTSTFSVDPTLQIAPNSQRSILSAFAEDVVKITNKIDLTGGARLDHYNNFGNTEFTVINPRLAATYNASANLIIKAIYASSFRPPAIYEVVGQGVPPLAGQSSVKPERVKMSEFSVLYKSDQFRLKLTGYYSTYTNGIQYKAKDATDPVLYATNVSDLNIVGTELDFNYQPSKDFYLFINGSKLGYLNNVAVYYLPNFYLNGGANLKLNRFNFNLTAYYRGKRALPSDLSINQPSAKAQFFTNLNTSYQVQGIKFYVMVENLFNGDYYMPLSADGFMHPLRSRIINCGLIVKM